LLLVPGLFASFQDALSLFFGIQPVTLTIQELRSWTLAEAWATYHAGWVLVGIGLISTMYRILREKKPDHLFILIWALIIVYSTFQHVRYEYYLGPVIALLGALGVGMVISFTEKDVRDFILQRSIKEAKEGPQPGTPSNKTSKRKLKDEKGKSDKKKKYDPLMILLFSFTIICSIIFVGFSTNYNYQVGNALGYNTIHPDWRETTEWLGNHTSDPGVDYYSIYDKTIFEYPQQSYGIMSWWDYGHWITFFAHRIPHANPFQEGVAGPDGAAAFFLGLTEDQTTTIADHLGTKYVITDIEMDTGKFWAMATWYNETLGPAPYSKAFLITSPDNPLSYQLVTLNTQDYYLSTISRLHNFDGSMVDPATVYYIEYADGTQETQYYPIITQALAMNTSAAIQMAEEYNTNAPTGYHATVASNSLVNPISRVPALQHFRLIHESPTTDQGDINYVKVFEYVPGARIKGEGILEITLITNTERTFTYRQESVNGEFIVPYSTEGNPFDVKAMGRYRITGTSQEFSVTEQDIQEGKIVG
jgi:dolichyl-diphosphooligosaccharide--protein glycosyltransferase